MKYLILVLFMVPGLASANCVNFTGKWAGTCTQTGGPDFPYSVEFFQPDCESIREGSHGKLIPGVESRNVNDERGRISHVSSHEWNPGKQVFQWLSSAHWQTPNDQTQRAHTGVGTYAIENGHFILRSRYTEMSYKNGVEAKKDTTYFCDLTLAPLVSPMKSQVLPEFGPGIVNLPN